MTLSRGAADLSLRSLTSCFLRSLTPEVLASFCFSSSLSTARLSRSLGNSNTSSASNSYDDYTSTDSSPVNFSGKNDFFLLRNFLIFKNFQLKNIFFLLKKHYIFVFRGIICSRGTV